MKITTQKAIDNLVLHRSSTTGTWTLNDVDLTCGDCIEVNIAGKWVRIRIEHDGHDYCAIPRAVRLYEGLSARFLRDRGGICEN